MKNKTLICAPSWLGDMVMTHSLVQLLYQDNRQTEIDILAPEWSRPVARAMGEIKTVITLPFEHGELALSERFRFGQNLAGIGYQRCYILPNSFKSALVPWFARIPERIGWKAEGRSVLLTDARKLDKSKLPQMHQRYAALSYHQKETPDKIPYPKLKHDPAEMRRLAARFSLSQDDKLIAVAPGAEFGPSKRWSIKGFSLLVQLLIEAGFRIVLMGSRNDIQLCQQIAGQTDKEVVSLAGKMTIEEVIHMLPICKALVCHDSGLMHIAAALDLPLVAIYGSTSPEHTPPLANRVKIIRTEIDCSPCYQRECPLKHHDCMRLIDPAKVYQAVEALVSDS